MSVTFQEEHHKYQSLDPNENIEWVSVTSFVSKFKQKFNAVEQSIKSSKNKRSKWYNIEPKKIQEIWAKESDRATYEGSKYHMQRENDLTDLNTLGRNNIQIPIIKPIYDGLLKIAPVQKLVEGIYPEHLVYLKSAGLCGQADRVEIIKNTVDIYDYKTNKEIKKESFKNWEGISAKMEPPLNHLEDCNFNHYSLQLSIYMYIILKHNPQYKPGKLMLHHIIFKKTGEDEYGYPILQKDNQGNHVIDKVVPYEVPYLKHEVLQIINKLKEKQI